MLHKWLTYALSTNGNEITDILGSHDYELWKLALAKMLYKVAYDNPCGPNPARREALVPWLPFILKDSRTYNIMIIFEWPYHLC